LLVLHVSVMYLFEFGEKKVLLVVVVVAWENYQMGNHPGRGVRIPVAKLRSQQEVLND